MKDTKTLKVTSKPRLNCQSCDKTFSSPMTLKSHMETVHEKIKLKCPSCDKHFTKYTLSSHIKIVHEGVNFNCDSCGKGFATSQNLKNHVRIVHEKVKIKCDSCDSTFGTSQNLKHHKRSVHEKIRFKCNLCDRTFAQPHTLKMHIRDFHQIIQVEKFNENLTMSTVKNDKDNSNDKDKILIEFKKDAINEDQTNDSESVKVKSEIEVHGNISENIQDESDQDELINEVGLDHHNKTVSGDTKNLPMDTVNHKKTNDTEKMLTEIDKEGINQDQIHDSESAKVESVKESEYDQVMSTQDELINDQDIKIEESREKPDEEGKKQNGMKGEKSPKKCKKFPCKWCRKGYVNSKDLKNHTKIVHGLEPNNCVSCGKKFESISGLTVHIKRGCKGAKVHKGVKFSCKSCNKTYLQKGGLNYHNKTVHQDIKVEPSSNENIRMVEVKHEKIDHNELAQIEINKADDLNEDLINDSEFAKAELVFDKEDQKDQEISNQDETDQELQHDETNVKEEINKGESDNQTESTQDDLVYDQDTQDEKPDQKGKKQSKMLVEKSLKMSKIFSCK